MADKLQSTPKSSDPTRTYHYGGQAVIEGVMMRGPKDFAVAVRRASGEIVTTCESIDSTLGRFKWLDKPFLRGTLALIDALVLGIRALRYSAEIAMQDASAADAQNLRAESASSDDRPEPSKVSDIAVGATMVLGLVVGLALFMLVPIVIVKPLKASYGLVGWQAAVSEGLVKIAIFVIYVAAISLLKDIRRVFQYHGAEHKTINAYEANEELTIENVQRYSKVHVRCGTSFILVVLLTSIVVFMFISWKSILLRFVYKLLLLPVVAGIAYEVIRFAGKHKNCWLSGLLVFPGLVMQKITTREPEPEMVEVAIKSLQCVLDAEAEAKGEQTTV
ncbi:MAG: DUF1385 domain-containing protein [Armatimonadota bacterium]|nr:DUF1385 domain-containing protein [Armatimonadota bacterium]